MSFLQDRAFLRRGERVLRRIGARLGSPRDEALVAGAEAAYALLTGRRVRGGGMSRHREPRIDPLRYRMALAALGRGDLDEAERYATDLLRAHPDSLRALRVLRDVAAEKGELHDQARALHRMHVLDDTPDRRHEERMVLGRIVETAPGWTPRIPGPPWPIDPDPGVVLHLLKESTPELTNGFTMRSRYDLLAQRDAGLRPVVVTSLGFPRLLGVTHVADVHVDDGIPYHRLDLGPGYDLDRPFDQLLEDQAWLTARIARTVRPEVIHVSSGHRGYETALVGQALRAHLRRPLVYEVRSLFEATWSADERWNERAEQYRRRFAAESRALRSADHVITIAEAMRDEIVDRGVPADHVSVIPNGVDASVFAPQPPDPALQRRYGLAGRFVFGYVSNLDHPRENQELLVAATARLLRGGRNVACLIVGDGRRRSEIERTAKTAGVGAGVVFTGRVPHDQVRGLYALLDAFVVPRRDERAARMVTPLKPYEALAMERPLVVADLPALREIAAPEERGLVFPAGDADALAASLARLIDDPVLRRRMGAAGREWVARERSWTANGPRFRAVYDAVLDRWGRGVGGAGGATSH